MKKVICLALLAAASVPAWAGGVRSLDMKANLRSDFGLGLGLTFQLPANFEFAPSANFYFGDYNPLTLDFDFRYRFELPKGFSIYPVVGPVYYHNEDYNHLGVNLGAGFSYDVTSNWAIGLELKYQYVDDFDDTYLSFGASYKF